MITSFVLSLALLANLSPVHAIVKGKAFDRIAIIWLENTDYDLAAGDPNLAWLAKKGISLTNYFAVTHPSMPNYAASISGDYYGINHDDMVAIPSNVSTLVDLLEDKGVSWGEYQEDMPSVGFQGKSYTNPKTGANMYVRKHNPAVLYDSVAQKTDRLAKTKPLTMFKQDMDKNQLPQWMFVTPNMTSDGEYPQSTVYSFGNILTVYRTRHYRDCSRNLDAEIPRTPPHQQELHEQHTCHGNFRREPHLRQTEPRRKHPSRRCRSC
jgi:acid phosphatase